MRSKTLRITYWSVTVLFCVLQAWSAVQYFIEAPKMMATIRELGYPVYFIKLLGVAKVLAVAAVLYGGFPRLKEWAYAGLTFDTLGAAFSHLAVGQSVLIAAVPLTFCAAQLTSYFLWKQLDLAHTSAARGLHARRPRTA
jgi:hypothetical protein